jgi:glycosyltransferase involved in cell wall biosynthesis
MPDVDNEFLHKVISRTEMTSPLEARQVAPGISVFFPAYNDAGTIASMVLAALHACHRVTDDYEVIVIENGSTDYTVEVVQDLIETHEHLTLVAHPEPLGYGGALRLGFELASKELVFYTDGDAQYDAHELGLLYAAMRPEVDIVQGYKIARGDPLFRKIIGRTYHWIVKIAFRLPIRDTDCDFRLIRKSALARFTLKSTTGTIPLELVKKLHMSGAVFAEVPVHHYHRVYGRSQFFNFKRLWATGIQLLQLWKELVLMPKLTGKQPVNSVKPAAKMASNNPSLIYQTERQVESSKSDKTNKAKRSGQNGARPPDSVTSAQETALGTQADTVNQEGVGH